MITASLHRRLRPTTRHPHPLAGLLTLALVEAAVWIGALVLIALVEGAIFASLSMAARSGFPWPAPHLAQPPRWLGGW